MTEYATTPSAIEEWNSQRNRTADWVQHYAVPGQPPPLAEDSDSDKHSLWDGSGWEPPSDCESSTSVPPSMILQYADSRQVLVTPTTSHADEDNGRSPSGSRPRARRTHTRTVTQSVKRDQENTEHTRSLRSAGPAQAVVLQSEPHAGAPPTQTSSMRLARAAAAPLPDSHSSSSGPRSTDVGRSALSSAPSNRPSHASSRHPSLVPPHPLPHPSHAASQHPSQHPSYIPSHQPSQAPSHHTAHPLSQHSQPNHPPSAFSNHTVVPPPPMAAGASPPSIHSIQSRSISLAESRSSGPPEPIVVHPPSATSSHSTAGPSPSHTQPLGQGHGEVYPQMHAAPASIRTQSASHAAHVPLPPPSIASKSLSYYSVPRQSHVYEQQQQTQEQRRQSAAPSHHTSQVQQNAQLPTPVSPTQNARAPYGSIPSRAPSTVTANGLGDGFVLVDAPSPGYEKELERELNEKKGSGKSTSSQRRERGSLFNVFGGGRPGGHNRSRSLPMAGVDAVQGEAAIDSPTSPYRHAPHHSQQNPYLSPISPTSPMSPYDPAQGPHPPPIVYAPARHHRATHYAPPRIMYMPASPPGQRHAPYDTHQYMQMHAHAYPQQGTVTGPGLVYATAPGHTAEYATGNIRRSATVDEGVRDSGWGEGKRDGSAVRFERGVNAADTATRDFAHEDSRMQSPTSPSANVAHASLDSAPAAAAATPPASHATVLSDPAHAPSVQSDATSAHTNMAGVGTATARSRSRGRGRLEGQENESERSRSRARGMVYSTSAPQPQGSAPHAAMMIPPSTTRDRGVRDTPYPTPPGSTNEYHHHSRQQQKYSPVSVVGANRHVLGSLAERTGEASPSQGDVVSRFRDYYHSSHDASPGAGDAVRESASTSPSRGRARERRRKESQPKLYKNGRARSAESQTSRSSASTYYVLPTPGQKVRIIRADGQTVTATTSISRNPPGGGWLKKATRFLHRDANTQDPLEKRKRGPTAPALASSRTPSHGSGVGSTKSGSKKSGRKLVRRNSMGSAALLSQASVGTGADAGADRDVDIVIPGQQL